MSEQPEALRLADALDTRVVPRWIHSTGQTPQQSGYAVDAECVQAAAELRRLHALLQEWEAKAATWLASPEAAQRLEGYCELAQRANRAEAERDALRAELAEYKSARNAYASEFPPDREGKHAVGIILQNIRTLKSERDALRAELDRLTTRFAQTINGPTHMGEPVLHASGDRDAYEGCREDLLCWKKRGQKAEAECDALRADAERYRWLRDPANAYSDEWNYFGPYSSETEIDAAIDAARAALKEAK